MRPGRNTLNRGPCLACRDAAQAQQWRRQRTPEPPALAITHKTDRFNRTTAPRELDVGVATATTRVFPTTLSMQPARWGQPMGLTLPSL